MIVLAAPGESAQPVYSVNSVEQPPRESQSSPPRSPSENFDLLVDPYYI